MVYCRQSNNDNVSKRKVVKENIGIYRYCVGDHNGTNANIHIQQYQYCKGNPEHLRAYGWKTLYSEQLPELEYKEGTRTKTKSWLGNGMQQDDINCSAEYTVTTRIYTKESKDAVRNIANQIAERMNIKFTSQIHGK